MERSVLFSLIRFVPEGEIGQEQVRATGVVLADLSVRLAPFLLDGLQTGFDLHCASAE